MREKIAETFIELWETCPYDKISVTMICRHVPVSRAAFYKYFTGKESLLFYYTGRDFERNCLPIFRFHLKEQGTASFFTYVKKNETFYRKLYAVDDGRLLFQCLKEAYKIGFDRRGEFSLQVSKRTGSFNTDIFFEYSCSGIAGVVVRWIREGMVISDRQMGRDLYLMISEPLSTVRDYYT